MTYSDIFERAKSVIGEENINDYRPAVFEGAPDTMCNVSVCVPYTIMIWLKNGDCIWYKAAQQEKDDFNEMLEKRKMIRDAIGF